jgi:hypothetical protein
MLCKKVVAQILIISASLMSLHAMAGFPQGMFGRSAIVVDVCDQALGNTTCTTVSDAKDIAMIGVTGSGIYGASGASGIIGALSEVTGASIIASAGIGVGAVTAGTALVGSSGGLGAASLLNRHLFNSDSPGDKAAQVGTYSGAVLGTIGSMVTLVSYGAGASGITAIGSTIGGGMAVGAIGLIAAPVATTIGIGSLTYWWFNK